MWKSWWQGNYNHISCSACILLLFPRSPEDLKFNAPPQTAVLIRNLFSLLEVRATNYSLQRYKKSIQIPIILGTTFALVVWPLASPKVTHFLYSPVSSRSSSIAWRATQLTTPCCMMLFWGQDVQHAACLRFL